MPLPFPFNTAFVILLDLSGLALAWWVYWAKRSDKVNQGFSLMVATILAWVTFYNFAAISPSPAIGIIWFRLATAVVFCFFIVYYFFIVEWFLNKKGFYALVGLLVSIYGIVFALIAAGTNLIIVDIKIIDSVVFPIFSQIGWWSFYGFVSILTICINWILLKQYFYYSYNLRAKIQYFLIGLLIFAGLNFVFNVIFPIFSNIYKFYEFGNYSAIFLLAFTAYAIVKSNLFGIKVLFTVLYVTLMVIVLMTDILVFTDNFIPKVLKLFAVFAFLGLGYLLIQSVNKEIRQREQLETVTRELEIANLELQRLDKAKSEFVSIASHQLRTPLTAIKGYISMILDGSYGKTLEKVKRPLTNVYASNERLIRLVNDLLNLSRIESGKIQLEVQDVQIDKVVQSILEELQIKAHEKNLKLIFQSPTIPLPAIKADETKIRNVLMNLVDNAIRYTEKGTITVTIELMNEKIQVRVADTGAGMEDEDLEELFESFSRGKAGNELWTEGTGLGLYVARQFIEMHGGKIWAESQGKGKGSTFLVELPIKSALPNDAVEQNVSKIL